MVEYHLSNAAGMTELEKSPTCSHYNNDDSGKNPEFLQKLVDELFTN